ncbi:MAG: hypothetical protein SPH20_06860, partial [Eubacterium sp.]|nr:hypothetical protein [Eubacterium sp.]
IFLTLKTALRIGASTFGLLIKTTFIKPLLSAADNNTENYYRKSEHSCNPYGRQAARKNAAYSKCNK